MKKHLLYALPLLIVVIALWFAPANHSQKSATKTAATKTLTNAPMPTTLAELETQPSAKATLTAQAKAQLALANPAVKANLNASMAKVNFVPNRGQYNQQVLYTMNTPQAQMVIFKDRIRLIALHKKGQDMPNPQNPKTPQPAPTEKHVVDIQFAGGNALKPTAIVGKDAPVFSWFHSDKNTAGVQAAQELRCSNVYAGIDLRLYSNKEGSLEFDWVVAKAGDYNKIKMQFAGQDKLSVDEKGNLDIGLRFGNLKLNLPQTYQPIANGGRVQLQAAFALNKNNQATYAIANLPQPNQPLIIDPTLEWGSWMDGNNASFSGYLFGGVQDASGNIYLAGSSEKITNTDLHALPGAPSGGFLSTAPDGTTLSASGDGIDWLVMKIKGDGSQVLQYTFFGIPDGVGANQAHCISISPSGNSVFVGGVMGNDGSPTTSLPLPAVSGGGSTAFGATTLNTVKLSPCIAIFNNTLTSLKYRSIIGGTAEGTLTGPVAVGQSQDISSIEAIDDNTYIIAGYTTQDLNAASSANYYIPAAAPDNTFSGAGNQEGFILKFTNFNTRVWGTYIGGDGNDVIYDMRTLSNGKLAFVGSSDNATNFPTTVNPINTTVNSGAMVVIGVLQSNGTAFTMLSRFGNSTSSDELVGLAVGPCDTLYATGYAQTTSFPLIAGNGGFQTTNGGGTANQDAIVLKCPSTGGAAGSKATYFGGTDEETGNSIAYLPVGNGSLMIFGSIGPIGTAPMVNITGNSFYQAAANGGYEMFFLNCSTDLATKNLATYVGGVKNDYLGETGVPVTGKQMLLLNDSTLGVFTTTHSATFSPNIISASGVIDNTKDASADLTHHDAWTYFLLNIADLTRPIDAGDAPISYGKATTQILLNAAKTQALLALGTKVDDDDYYPASPGTLADADNLEGSNTTTHARKASTAMYYVAGAADAALGANTNDEDAITTQPFITYNPTGTNTYSITVPFYNNSGTSATIYGYIDFNNNGSFTDAGETATATVASNATNGRTTTLTWTCSNVACSSSAINTYMRLVIVQGTGAAGLSGCGGGFSNPANAALGYGEVEDYTAVIQSNDYGNLPTATWPAAYASVLNAHQVWLGPNAAPTFECATNTADRADGFTITDAISGAGTQASPWLLSGTGGTYHFTVTVNGVTGDNTTNPVYYAVWYDGNGNGSFTDASDLFFTGNLNHGSAATTSAIAFTVPAGGGQSSGVIRVAATAVNPTFTQAMGNTSLALTNGEVQDFYVSYQTPLPVTLTGFTATLNNCAAQLSWQTANELNSKAYQIEQSADGVNYVQAASVVSKNDANGASYSYKVGSLFAGINYFRLKAVDADGKFTYSNIATVHSTCKGAITITPNPTNDIINIAGLQGKNSIQIFNTVGQKITEVQSTGFIKQISLAAFAKGVYTIRIVDAQGAVTNAKVVKE